MKLNKGSGYYDLIANEVISIKKLNWPEAKAKFFDIKKLARTDASTHPKQVIDEFY